MRKSIGNILAIVAIVFLFAGCNPLSSNKISGAIKTSNGGVNWLDANQIAGDNKLSLSGSTISLMTFDPNKREVVYASSYSDGLFKSEDSAGSWKQILSRISVYDVAIQNDNPDVIYAAGYVLEHGKLLKSTDGGKSWEEIYSEETVQNAVRAVTINPSNSNEVVIGLTSGNIVKSLDGGRNWVLVKNFEDRVNRVRFQGNSLFAIFRTKGMYVSTDGGVNFTPITDPITYKSGTADGLFLNSTIGVQSFAQFAVNTSNPSEIYVSTDRGVYKTDTLGKTWVKLPIPIQDENSQARAIAISPSNTKIVYMSVGSTIYKTLDGGLSFQTQGIATDGFINYILVDPTLPQIAYAGVFNE